MQTITASDVLKRFDAAVEMRHAYLIQQGWRLTMKQGKLNYVHMRFAKSFPVNAGVAFQTEVANGLGNPAAN